MIHLHWSMFAAVVFVAVVAGMVLMGVAKDELRKQLRARLVAARAENDRLQLACDTYEKALEGRCDQIVELAAELVILRNSGNPPEAA